MMAYLPDMMSKISPPVLPPRSLVPRNFAIAPSIALRALAFLQEAQAASALDLR